jgi:hypothetical protein
MYAASDSIGLFHVHEFARTEVHSGIRVHLSPRSRLYDSVTGCGSRCDHSIVSGVPATNSWTLNGDRLKIAGNASVSLLTCSSVAVATTSRAPLVIAKPIVPNPSIDLPTRRHSPLIMAFSSV